MRLPLSAVLSAALLGSSLLAQTPLSGNVFDGNGGPLLSGTVYHATNNLVIPANQTLTVQAGAILKFASQTFTVDGALVVTGTPGNPAIFTSLRDDSAGGDTNGDGGASSPTPGSWWGVNLRNANGPTASLQNLELRYTGAGGWAAITANHDATLTDCVFRDCARGGLLTSSSARPTVSGCRFERIAGQPAMRGLHLESVPGYSNNTAIDCSGGNYGRVDSPSVGAGLSVQVTPNNVIGGVLLCGNNAQVQSTANLTLDAGVTVKVTGSNTITVDGALVTNGTATNPVVFTSFSDDSAGGDTNGDGPSAGSAGQWWGVSLRSGASGCLFQNTEFRYTGAGGWDGLRIASPTADVFDCVFSDGSSGGLDMSTTARPRVERCRFERIARFPAIDGVGMDALPGFLDNTTVDCSGGNFLRVANPSTNAVLRIQKRNLVRDTLMLANNMVVRSAAVLTIDPGVVVKPAGSNTITVDGTLLCNGTSSEPVVFTSFSDDTAGGDTNGDGPSTGVPGQWWGISLRSASTGSRLEHTHMRFCGAGGWGALMLATDITALDCRFTDCARGGINCGTSNRPTIEDCHFARIAGNPAIYNAALDAVPAFEDNTATNCPGGAFIRITDPSCRTTTRIGADNQVGGALVMAGNMQVLNGAHLTLNSGVVLKFSGVNTCTIDGRFDTNGPVVITHIQDDAFGGDTNGDGNATTPSPNLWWGINFRGTASGFVDRCLVRWTGAGGWNGINCVSPTVDLVRTRVEFAGQSGFSLTDCSSARGLTAFANGRDGISLRGGSFSLIRSTAAFNGNEGVESAGTWSGAVRSTISKFNSGTDFAGFAAGEVSFCNGGGIVGGVGNLDVDPLFVAAAAGDLRLSNVSPCIDVGAPSDITAGVDALGFPRYLDGDLDGVQRIDMGAHEFDNAVLIVTGNPTPGGTLTATVASEPGIQIGVLAFGFGAQAPIPLFNLGAVYFDLGLPYDAFVVGTASSTQIPIPNGIATPLQIVFQYIGIRNPFPLGNTSNAAIIQIR